MTDDAQRLAPIVERLKAVIPYQGKSNVAFLCHEAAGTITALAEALAWYKDKAADCRKHGPDGDAARQALDADGGRRASEALAKLDNQP